MFSSDKDLKAAQARVTELEASLATAQAEKTTLTEQVSALTAERDSAKTEATTSAASLATVTAERDSLTGQVAALSKERDDAKTEAKAATDSIPGKVAEGVARICAEQGITPDKTPPGEQSGDKSKGLTGLALATSLIKVPTR